AATAILVASSFPDEIADTLSRYNPAFSSTISWSLGVFQRGAADPVLNDLVGQPVPPVTLETLLGTGLVVDRYGNASGNDSGYIQTYYALGLVMAAVFYLAVAALMLKYAIRARYAFPLMALVASMFIVEYKEPFVFKYTYPFFVLG